MLSRRRFLSTLVGSAGIYSCLSGNDLLQSRLASNGSVAHAPRQTSPRIDRASLVRRHNPRLNKIDSLSPLTVGNGEFAFTADVTGLQTLSRTYEDSMPLCTMSQWGWHTVPAAAPLKGQSLRLTPYDVHGRSVSYATSSQGQTELFNWLRENPHRLHLCRISLRSQENNGAEIEAEQISAIDQELDLWQGVLKSKFELKGQPVSVTTAVHPRLDLLAVAIESSLIAGGRLGVQFDFPYGSSSMQAADWNQPDKHRTHLTNRNHNRALVQRTLDEDSYSAIIEWMGQATLAVGGKHRLILNQPGASEGTRLEFVVAFAPQVRESSLPTVAATLAASNTHWQHFWTNGGAVELSGSTDRRAGELERRVVLSQYLTAIQCAGRIPPQETGLTVNSWYGKFHLEMHWWHAAHFALWNRLPLFERSLSWYESILPSARERAHSQGYAGARWPKMVGPEGRDSPSPIGPLLIWQQPHPIIYAELCYLSHSGRETLARYRDVVFETAAFMASYAFFDNPGGRFMLGPPVIPAQENHPPRETWNPTFELAYWRHGLTIANRWRERLGLKANAEWERVIDKLSPLPQREGVFLAHENCPQTYTERNHDHPSMLGALGFLPGDNVDRPTMHRTLLKVMKEWRWDQTWGWDYPLTAMTAARLGEPEIAVDALLMETEKNRYLANGHNWQRENLPCYLPGNGGLLYAIAMMAGGWHGAPSQPAPGFPANGSWRVQAENLNGAVLREI